MNFHKYQKTHEITNAISPQTFQLNLSQIQENKWKTCILIQEDKFVIQKLNNQRELLFQSYQSKIKPITCSFRLIDKNKITESTQNSQRIQNDLEIQKKERDKIISEQIIDQLDNQQVQQSGCEGRQKQGRISQTKHMIKNFGRAIISYILKEKQMLSKKMGIDKKRSCQFVKHCRRIRSKVLAIKQLRGLWLQQQCKYAKQFRTISQYYLKKMALKHIFNSRVVNHKHHIKCRTKFIQAVRNPSQFTSIKQY